MASSTAEHQFWGVAPFRKPTPEETANNQRRRLLLGVSHAVAHKGYSAASVSDVLDEARVSRRTFYELFRDKEDCYLAAYDVAHEAMINAVKQSQHGVRDPVERVEVAHRSFLEFIGQHPDIAQAFLVGVIEAGPRASERRQHAYLEFADMHATLQRQCRRKFPALPRVPGRAFVALTAGTNIVVIDELRQHGAEHVMSLLPDLLFLAYSIYGLREQAAAAFARR